MVYLAYVFCLLSLNFSSFLIADAETAATPMYYMKTASIVNEEVVFESDNDFEEAIKVGFFRIKAPQDLDLEVGRIFARTFTSDLRYREFGVLDVVNGYLKSDVAQTVRFTLERDNWDKCHVDQKETIGEPNYPVNVQKLGQQMAEMGVVILQSILRRYQLPEDLWFEATGGSSNLEGSHFLLFNCYDPKLGDRTDGVGAHKDWGSITVLDAPDPGLEAEIDGVWKSLHMEDGYLTINFGYCLEKLLPGVKASNHRVVTQKEKMRISTVLFTDPRVGFFRNSDKVGYVYDWDPMEKKLIHGEPTTTFFEALSNKLYGSKQD
ncbi:MAG: hypothetical protein K2Y01_07045 [Rhabdochlamydiaceae bacterium]|nr:hypothetical protein [Rhabdochlamydiaceae bacterium]